MRAVEDHSRPLEPEKCIDPSSDVSGLSSSTVHESDVQQQQDDPLAPEDKVQPSLNPVQGNKDNAQWNEGWRFIMVLLALSISGLLTSLENTITSTALLTIVDKLHGDSSYVWAVNAYTLTMTVFQPLYGQSADIFGRRYPILTAVAFFTIGSGVCGAANNMATLIAGRALQGIGAGGVNVLNEILICDVVPLRQRGQYIAFVFGLTSLGTAAGPIFGGLIITYSSWRWAFWISVPIGGSAFIMMILLLHVKHKRQGGILAQVSRIDWVGNIIFIASVIAVLYPLATAGTAYPWRSWNVLVPLLLGLLVGFPLFLCYENSRCCIEPTMPLHLFRNRTTLIAFLVTFLHAMATMWAIYFLPVYFQGVKEASPARSGVMLMPFIVVMLPFLLIGGKCMEMSGRYKPVHIVGLAIMMIGYGLFTLLDRDSSMAAWIIFQMVETAGVGVLVGVLLPAVQASLKESDTALSASTWGFLRSFGLVWGVAIPAAVFNGRFDQLAPSRISDPNVVATLSHGKAYEHATKAYLKGLQSTSVRDQTISVFRDSMKEVWYIGLAFTGLAFVLAFFEGEVELRKDIETEFGLKQKKALEKAAMGV